MQFRSAILDDLSVIISWIQDADACRRWAGPLVNYPLTPESLAREIEFAPGNTYGLEGKGSLVGFGQLIHKCKARGHAARIIVAPGLRGRGIGRSLCLAIIKQAVNLKYCRVSLNVYRDNPAAIQLYSSLGFCEAEKTKGESLSNEICYMEIDTAEKGIIALRSTRSSIIKPI